MLRDVELSDRYDLTKSSVLLSGTQALVRATLMQRARDKAEGLNTAAYVSGYRGSPLGAVDAAFQSATKLLEPANIKFQAGLNEDIAATAIWGTQQAELRGEGLYDGVFGFWYGKGPGVDRSGDVLRHANLAGSSASGGVLVAAGDDHTCESSTTCHQSELALIDAMIPILSPAGVQELLDFSIHGWAMSRFSGCWVGLKSVKDTIEATAVVNADPARVKLQIPSNVVLPFGGLNIRLRDTPQEQEARLHDHKIPAAQAYARANTLDYRVHGAASARVGIVSSGKSWLDTSHALEMMGLSTADLEQMGITTYKVGLVWPLDQQSFQDWAEGLDTIIVVEEKRPILEPQVREAATRATVIIGSNDANGDVLFPSKMDLNPAKIALGLARALGLSGLDMSPTRPKIEHLRELAMQDTPSGLIERKPWFCAGCPHSSSTKLPEGARAFAGIGCHYMAQWMDRETSGHTHMGGEGANWIGESRFSKRSHVFQNMGDGTYNHSGSLAVKAAVYSGANITYKILYNDAVAMTGGQTHEGAMSPFQIAAELTAFGVRKVVAVIDEKEDVPALPKDVPVVLRKDLERVQRELQTIEGVTAIVYIQTCAAEKRRRRKRGQFPDPDKRVFINPAVCEGCGDCGKASNCVAILPLETPLGRKRKIDQSSCNKDFSCLNGFCPSFVTLSGTKPKTRLASELSLPDLPDPVLPALDGVWSILITGIGGTGVVTVGALLTMAAHLEGKGAAELQMAGLAQKGGAVSIHCRIAPTPEDIKATRLAVGEANAVISGDMVVTAAQKSLELMQLGKTRVLASTHEAMTGQFTLDPEFRFPRDRLLQVVENRVGSDAVQRIDGVAAAKHYLGNSIYSNVLLLGAAWQAGLIPLSREALHKAIKLNGAGVEGNLRAFEIGRWLIAAPTLPVPGVPTASSEESKIESLAKFLANYQGLKLAERFRNFVGQAAQAEKAKELDGFSEAVAEGYFKLLSYKDEYEVARLHCEFLDNTLAQEFETVGKIKFHLAPPIFARKDEAGHPVKTEFGTWMRHGFRILAKFKFLRGTVFDIFGYTAERQFERRLIEDYERDIIAIFQRLSVDNLNDAIALAKLPTMIKGFGHVKQANAELAGKERTRLIAQLHPET
jgi:indolepyruvate ferredoxin oxidoreductase